MIISERQKTITETIFTTRDGKEFLSESKASLHEDFLDGSKKVCDKCLGKGRVNGRYEDQGFIQNDEHFATGTKQVWIDDKCDRCKGKGHLEQKWV